MREVLDELLAKYPKIWKRKPDKVKEKILEVLTEAAKFRLKIKIKVYIGEISHWDARKCLSEKAMLLRDQLREIGDAYNPEERSENWETLQRLLKMVLSATNSDCDKRIFRFERLPAEEDEAPVPGKVRLLA